MIASLAPDNPLDDFNKKKKKLSGLVFSSGALPGIVFSDVAVHAFAFCLFIVDLVELVFRDPLTPAAAKAALPRIG